MVKTLNLIERLDSLAATDLRNQIAAAEGEDIALNAARVAFLGGLCLELLMCARQIWAASGKAFTIESPSDAFVENLSRFGLTPQAISSGGRA